MKEAARKAAQTKEHLADIVNVMLEELVKQHYELPAFIRLTDAPSTRKGISTMSATSGLCEK